MVDEFGALVAEHVGSRIRRRRRVLEISQEELGNRAGVHRTAINLYEHGRVTPRLETLVLIARVLEVTETQLLAGIDEEAVESRRRRPRESSDAPIVVGQEHDLTVAERSGGNLRRLRLREDMTQEGLARRAGLHRNAISRLEAGERVPLADTLVRLADSLGVAPAELLDGIEWVPASDSAGSFVFGSSQMPEATSHV
jgi:transcriptional regulator with XRE-family HTH domain